MEPHQRVEHRRGVAQRSFGRGDAGEDGVGGQQRLGPVGVERDEVAEGQIVARPPEGERRGGEEHERAADLPRELGLGRGGQQQRGVAAARVAVAGEEGRKRIDGRGGDPETRAEDAVQIDGEYEGSVGRGVGKPRGVAGGRDGAESGHGQQVAQGVFAQRLCDEVFHVVQHNSSFPERRRATKSLVSALSCSAWYSSSMSTSVSSPSSLGASVRSPSA